MVAFPQVGNLGDRRMKPKKTRCFASGGKIDPEQLLRNMQAKYGVSATPKEPEPQAPPPPPVVATTQKPQGGGLLGQAVDAYSGRAAKIEKEVGYANGGKIKGPGTSISDSIPAKIRETGEPIRVSNKERIVSEAQDKALDRIAEMLGYGSVDEMFMKMTNKPVGPTIKAGKKKTFATGGALDEYGNDLTRSNAMGAAADKMRNDRLSSPVVSGLQSTRVGAVTQNNLQNDPLKTLTNQVDMGRAVENSNLTMTEKAVLGMGTSAAAASDMRKRTDALSSLRDGIAEQQQPNIGSAWVGGGNGDPLNPTWMRSFSIGGKIDPNRDYSIPEEDQKSATEAQANKVQYVPTIAALPDQKEKFNTPDFSMIAADPKGYEKVRKEVAPNAPSIAQAASTIRHQSPIEQGLQERTFSQPVQPIADLPEKAANPIRDGVKVTETPAYTGIDGKPTNNWYETQRYKDQIAVNDRMTRLANQMERDRLKRDMGADITNPNVKESARMQLAALETGLAANDRGENSAVDRQAKSQDIAQGVFDLSQKRILAGLRNDYLGADTDEKKSAIMAKITAMTGADASPIYKGLELSGGSDSYGNKFPSTPVAINQRTGEFKYPVQTSGMPPTFQSKAELQAAIKAGTVKSGQIVNTPNGPITVK